jgi:type IV secretory pathway VirB10-like protein
MSRSSIDPVALSVERHEGALRKAAITSGIIGGIVSLVVLIFIGQRLRQENAEQPAQKPPSQIVEAPARATLSPQALEAFPTGATEPAPKTTAQPDQPAASTAAPTSVPPQRSERRLGTRTASRKDQPGASDARTRDLPLLE